MVRSLSCWFPLSLWAFAAFAGSCGSGPGTEPSGVCGQFDYTAYRPASAPTLARDIVPIFRTSCALSSACHANGRNPPNLGGDQVQPATIAAALVGMPSEQTPGMKYVVPGAPAASWLMRKVEASNPGCDLGCVAPAAYPDACSQRMPRGGPAMDPALQARIRDWIQSGAM